MEIARENSPLKILCCLYVNDVGTWVQSNRETPYWRLYWNPKPGSSLAYWDGRIDMTPDKIYIIPGFLAFSTFSTGGVPQFYIHFNPDGRTRRQDRIFSIPATENLLGMIRRHLALPVVESNQQELQILENCILETAILMLPPEILALPDKMDPRISRIEKMISEHPEQHYSNAGLAKIIGMETNSFIRLFRKEVRETPARYINKKRVEKAGELLHFTDLSIDETAEACGFADRYHFTRIFNKYLGLNPGHYKKGNSNIVNLKNVRKGP